MEHTNNRIEEELLDNYRKQLLDENRIMLSKHHETIKNFSTHCSNIGISLSDENFSYSHTTGVICEYPGILSKLIPDLVIDKEGLAHWGGLLSVLSLEPFNPGYLYANKFMAMASPIFRRGLHSVNNWAPRFIDIFWNLADPNIESYISLDNNRVRINVDSSRYIEADTWYGAPFNEDISKINDGVTHLRPPSDLEERYLDFLFNNAYALDIIWSTKDRIKSFQGLEFKRDNITTILDNQEFYPVRYLHAEYDLENCRFRHFDGAVQYHTEEEYYARRDSNFRHNIKDAFKIKPTSVKAFKLNGSISVDVWTEFSSHFFASNPLIHEYFSGTYPAHLAETLLKIRTNRKAGTES